MERTILRSTLPTTLIIFLLSAARGSAARHRTIDRPSAAAAAAAPQGRPAKQAQDAVSTSLDAARAARALAARLSGDAPALSPPEASAVGDCAVALGDAVGQLQRSLDALGSIARTWGEAGRGGEKQPRMWVEMNDVQTWVSAALTDENMCAQGFTAVEGEVKRAVTQCVGDAAERTSNALALINGLCN